MELTLSISVNIKNIDNILIKIYMSYVFIGFSFSPNRIYCAKMNYE